LIGWVSKKQTTAPALSTAEAEFNAATAAIKDIVWLQNVLSECGIASVLATVYIDNQAAIAQLKREASSSKMQHIDLKLKFIKHYVRNGQVQLAYIRTSNQVADVLTKALAPGKFEEM
jgi:uncharacterized protein YbcC (UPF0753/DUF2309 family)